MIWEIDKLAFSTMKGFGLGMILAVLTSGGGVLTANVLMSNSLTILFTFLGLGLGFESVGTDSPPVKV
jgi:hypothetical protein